jgi:hypothetical protein
MKKALVLSLAVVLGLGVASFAQGVLSGSWDSTITIDPQLSLFTGFDSTIAIEYAISGWTFSSETVVDLHGWVGQQFGFDGALGAFTMGGTVDFTPMPAVFNYALVTGGVSLAGVEFGVTCLLENFPDIFTVILLPPWIIVIPGDFTGDLGVELTASGTAGAVTIDVTVGFGDIDVVPFAVDLADGVWDYDHIGNGVCDLDWNSIAIEVTFPFCCAEVTGSLSFDCAGFESACFEVDNIAIPNLPWLDIDAKVCFDHVWVGTLQTGSYAYDKSFLVRPGFTLGTIACFDIYAYLDVSAWGFGLTLQSISIQGFGLECDIGGVTFTGLTWFGPKAPKGILAGTTYFEAYQIKTTDDGCCGPFDFDLTFFFEQGGLALFDIAEVVANVSYELGANFIFTTGLTVDMGTIGIGFSEWTIGFEVTW